MFDKRVKMRCNRTFELYSIFSVLLKLNRMKTKNSYILVPWTKISVNKENRIERFILFYFICSSNAILIMSIKIQLLRISWKKILLKKKKGRKVRGKWKCNK